MSQIAWELIDNAEERIKELLVRVNRLKALLEKPSARTMAWHKKVKAEIIAINRLYPTFDSKNPLPGVYL